MRTICLYQKYQYKNIGYIRKRRQGEGNREPIQRVDENSPNLWKELDPRIQEANRTPSDHSTKKPSPKHTVLKLSKINDKDRILKTAREKKKSNLQRKAHEIIIKLLSRNSTSQKRVEPNIQTTERENLTAKNNISSEVIL